MAYSVIDLSPQVQNIINKNQAVLEPGLVFKEHLSPSFQRNPEMKTSIRKTKNKNKVRLVKNAKDKKSRAGLFVYCFVLF